MVGQPVRSPRPFTLYASAVLALGLAAMMASWVVAPPHLDLRLVLLVSAALVSELFSFSFPTYSMSLGYPLAIAASIMGGPSAAGLVAVASSVSVQDLREHKSRSVMVFNTGQLLLSIAAGAWTYVLLGGRVLAMPSGRYLPLDTADFPGVLLGIAAAGLVSYGANVLLVSTGIALAGRAPFRRAFLGGLALLPTQLSLAMLGVLMAQVLAIAAVTLPLFIFPLAIARQFYQSYVGLNAAYRDTVRSLVGALETKDAYTRGHSVRVAAYARQIAEAMGLDPLLVERLEYAGLLHDLGKLSIAASVLTKPTGLSDVEFEQMTGHPARGAEIVSRIPPARDLAEVILHHHERLDGKGYPSGRVAGEIPLLARILSVADSFDAMTTNRAYRKALTAAEAVIELRRCAGSQFDHEVVEAFIGTQLVAEGLLEPGVPDLLLTTEPVIGGGS